MELKTKTDHLNNSNFGNFLKGYLFIAILWLIIILLVILVIFPFFKKIKENSKELLFQKNNLFSFSEEIKNLQESKNLYDSYLKNLEKIDRLFINSQTPLEFINFLEKEAAQSQLTIEVFPTSIPKRGKETDIWQFLSFRISATGELPHFLQFLEKLENSPYLIEIFDLNIKKIKKEETSANIVGGTILIKAFAQ